MRTVRYSLASIPGCSDHEGRTITAFTIRATDGTDEAHAAKMAEKNASQMTEELIRFSLVSFETESGNKGAESTVHKIDHTPGFAAFDKWSTKARNFVVAAWRKLSTPDDAELSSFFESATDLA